MGDEHRGWSEDRLHRWLAEQDWPVGLAGSRGHDAAVLPGGEGRDALCADQCVEGVHFEAAADPRAAGAKAVLRTISDLAAAAARPRAVTLAVRAPADRDEGWLRAVILGARAAARTQGAELVAGDLTQGEGPASLVVTALGAVAAEGRPVGRDRARPGQSVILTGPVGGSLARGRHLAPTPRIEEARALAAAGATALMDVSDGLALDLFRIARASGVRIELDVARVPVHEDAREASRASGRTALDHALHDGEDHELIATLDDPSTTHHTVIGRVVSGEGLVLLDGDRREAWSPGRGGWTHGGAEERDARG
jgi:thiamine-monophosphate kinase